MRHDFTDMIGLFVTMHHMPHVVAYVVAYVVLVWPVDVCFGRLQTCRGARVGLQWARCRLMHRSKWLLGSISKPPTS
jgi:hypothetical protein